VNHTHFPKEGSPTRLCMSGQPT